tara:strand:- start:1 stop:198 length:198 start_codon:yes stop_codon:yes gene_type:complete
MSHQANDYAYVSVDNDNKVIGLASKEIDAKDMARRNKGTVVTLKKPVSCKTGDMMVNRTFDKERY